MTLAKPLGYPTLLLSLPRRWYQLSRVNRSLICRRQQSQNASLPSTNDDSRGKSRGGLENPITIHSDSYPNDQRSFSIISDHYDPSVCSDSFSASIGKLKSVGVAKLGSKAPKPLPKL